jgi:hypothetical protein
MRTHHARVLALVLGGALLQHRLPGRAAHLHASHIACTDSRLALGEGPTMHSTHTGSDWRLGMLLRLAAAARRVLDLLPANMRPPPWRPCRAPTHDCSHEDLLGVILKLLEMPRPLRCCWPPA